jgi:hypothetical protein
MSGLERRLRVLEDESGLPCPECGSGTRAKTEYTIEWADPHEDLEPEFCLQCGEQLLIIVRWGMPLAAEPARTYQ